MSKILITGGSGFIGTNLVEHFCTKGFDVINFDVKKPRNKAFLKNWIEGNILDKNQIKACFESFNPEYVIHLAARTDLNEAMSINGYNVNIEGVENIVNLINTYPSVKRTIYASSRMVCKINYIPESYTDYCPPNLYGESKVLGEQIVRKNARHDFVIVRPTSIWGPSFEIPYKTFFDTVRKKIFFIPKNHNPKKSFGFVYNSVFQLEKILFATKEDLKENYYLTDYPALELKSWANLISKEFNNSDTLEIPIWILKIASKIGDVLVKLGWQNPPLTSFRLNNLISNMVYNTNDLEKLCGNLPYRLEQGVKITTDWMKENN